MTLELSEEQEMLQSELRSLFAEQAPPDRLRMLIDGGEEWDEPLWRELCGLGFGGASIPECFGGLGLKFSDVLPISEELGRSCAALPVCSSIFLVAQTILIAGSDEQKSKWLPKIATGEVVGTYCLGFEDGKLSSLEWRDGCLWGTVSPVPDGGISDFAIFPAKSLGGTVLCLVDLTQQELTRRKLNSFDQLRAHYAFEFVGCKAELLREFDASSTMTQVSDLIAIHASMEAVGGAQVCLEMAVNHAMERQIFGKPLAGYQAIKHRLADAFAKIELARANCKHAAQLVDTSSKLLPVAAAAARLSAMDAYEFAARENMQIHGGISYTFESNCHFYFRRERTLALSFGGRHYWSNRLIGNLPNAVRHGERLEADDDARQLESYRCQARLWLAANAPANELPVDHKLDDHEIVERARVWQRTLYDSGYAGIILPKAIGGQGATVAEYLDFAEEEAQYRLPKGPYMGIGQGMAMAVIQRHGSRAQIERFVGPTLRGEITWCQLFSEPAAGSDLAALRTRADKVDGGWLVNGQKVWSSWAHEADFGLLLARSDSTLPKHKGLSFYLLDMMSSGIEVVPIRQISGARDFNETFLNDVFVPDDCRLGADGDGWSCAMTVLNSERLNAGTEEPTCTVEELVSLASERCSLIVGEAVRSDLVVALGQAYSSQQAERLLQARLRAMISTGKDPGALPSALKLSFASRLQKMSGIAMEMLGADGIASMSPDDGLSEVHRDYLWSVVMRIAGGADEVLRNQLAERVLQLPKEERADRNVAFRDMK